MRFLAQTDGQEYEVQVEETPVAWKVSLTHKTAEKKDQKTETQQILKKDFQPLGEFISLIFNHRSYLIDIVTHRDDYIIFTRGSLKTVKLLTEERLFFKELVRKGGGSASADVHSGLPGKIASIAVKEGDQVSAGGLLLVIEAMKMENEIRAEEAGVVKKIYVSTGQNVTTSQRLLSLKKEK